MPKVSEFFGIEVVFNYRGEHNPPHFHARHSGREGVFAISPLAYLHGDLIDHRGHGDDGGGALDRIYKINKIFRISDEGYRSALAFALRMGRLKIPNPTSELAGMRFFTPRS